MTTEKSNSKFKKEGDFIAFLGTAVEGKPSRAVRAIDKLIVGCSDEDLRKIVDEAMWLQLRSDDPEERRQALSMRDNCPCCGHWLGHNRPPAGDEPEAQHYRRQGTLKL